MSCQYSFQFTCNFLFLLSIFSFLFFFNFSELPSVTSLGLKKCRSGQLSVGWDKNVRQPATTVLFFQSSASQMSLSPSYHLSDFTLVVDPLNLFFPSKTVLAILCALHFHTNFRISLSIYAGNVDEILIVITVNKLTNL